MEVFRGVLIPPGAEFSFNRVSGFITLEKGYRKTQVIIGGEVKEGVGGGVCQSSTTVYRGIVNAGFPVLERRSHSLDVVYYHQYGYGIDATVYQETGQDLRFINDTPGYLLMNAIMAPHFETLIEFYGTSDGRRVELEPVVSKYPLQKSWYWRVIKGDEVEERMIHTVYQPEKKAEEVKEEDELAREA